jgi:hypothetical protein
MWISPLTLSVNENVKVPSNFKLRNQPKSHLLAGKSSEESVRLEVHHPKARLEVPAMAVARCMYYMPVIAPVID